MLKGLGHPKKIAQFVLINFHKAFDFVDYTVVAVTELNVLGGR